MGIKIWRGQVDYNQMNGKDIKIAVLGLKCFRSKFNNKSKFQD